tara:strand:+ start:119 stop:865 length:747 start_codon:yes stop_codon:yes gene_type:complete
MAKDTFWSATDGGVKWDAYCGSLVKWFDTNQKQMGVSKGLESSKVRFCNSMYKEMLPPKKDIPKKSDGDYKKYVSWNSKNKSLIASAKKKKGFNVYKNTTWKGWYRHNNADAQYLYHSGGKQFSTDFWSLMEALHNIREKNKIGAKDKKALMHWKIKTNFKPLKTKATSKKKTTKRKRKAPAKKKTTTRKRKTAPKKSGRILRGKRNSPSTSATSVSVGTKRRGGDGKLYVCKTYKRGNKRVKRWFKV